MKHTILAIILFLSFLFSISVQAFCQMNPLCCRRFPDQSHCRLPTSSQELINNSFSNSLIEPDEYLTSSSDELLLSFASYKDEKVIRCRHIPKAGVSQCCEYIDGHKTHCWLSVED